MSIPDSVIDQLNEHANLVAIIKRHTDLKPNGKEFKGRCPFHGDKTPSFFVNPEKNMYHCFGCGAGGNAISFLMDYERLTFMEALKTLSEQTGIELPKEDQTKYSYQRTQTVPHTTSTTPAQHRSAPRQNPNLSPNGTVTPNNRPNAQVSTSPTPVGLNAHFTNNTFADKTNNHLSPNAVLPTNANLPLAESLSDGGHFEQKDFKNEHFENGHFENEHFENGRSKNKHFDNLNHHLPNDGTSIGNAFDGSPDNQFNPQFYGQFNTHLPPDNLPPHHLSSYNETFDNHSSNHHSPNQSSHAQTTPHQSVPTATPAHLLQVAHQELQQELDGTLYSLLRAVSKFYQLSLKDNQIAHRYLLNRGLSQETIDFFELGYAPTDWQHLEKAFPNDLEGLKLLGLIRTSQKGRAFNLFRDRVIFPIKDKQGRIVGFAGRALDDETLPKYINSSDSVIFQKNHILYGYYESRLQKSEKWLVVEGYLDVISLYQAGIYGAVAPMGTAINDNQIAQLLKFNDELTLCFDGDNAGQKAAWRALEVAMPILTDGKSLKFLTLPDNHDPDTYTKQHGKDKMQSAINHALSTAQYLYETVRQRYDLSQPEQKAAAMRDIKALTDKLPKGSSFRSWLNNDLYQRLRGTRHRIANAPTNYNAKQLSLTEQLALCLLYEPSITASIVLNDDNVHAQNPSDNRSNNHSDHHQNTTTNATPDDPLAQFFAQSGLDSTHLPFETRLTELNLATPPLPTWDDFCYQQVYQDETLIAKTPNELGELIHLIWQALPILPADNRYGNAVFLLSAMNNGHTKRQLCEHWTAFYEHLDELSRQETDGKPAAFWLLFNELLHKLTLNFIKNTQHHATHLIISQLHNRRLTALDNWLRQHNLLLDN